MFGQQQGGFPAAAGQPPSGGSRSSVFGGSVPGGSGGPPSAASVFGGHVPGRSGTASFPTPSVFGGSPLHGMAAAAASGQPLSGIATPAAVFGSSQPTAVRSVFGTNPVAVTPSGAGAAAFSGQQQVAAKSFFGSLPSAPSAIQRPAAEFGRPTTGQQLNSGGVGLPTVVSVSAAGSSRSGPPASPSSVFGAHARSASRQPFAYQHGPATPSVFGSQPAPEMVLAGGSGQQQQNTSLVSVASSQSGGNTMPLSSAPASVPFGRAGASAPTTAGAAASTSGLIQSMSGRTDGPATDPASAHPVQLPVPASMPGPGGLLFGKAVPSGVTAGLATPAAGGSPSTMQTAALQLAGLMRPLYSEIADLSENELAQFKASHFTVDNIPLKPPPRQLVH